MLWIRARLEEVLIGKQNKTKKHEQLHIILVLKKRAKFPNFKTQI